MNCFGLFSKLGTINTISIFIQKIKQKHILLLKQRKEEKVKKEKAKQQELEQLTKDIEKIGGLWVSNQDFEEYLGNFPLQF
jgi:hypothetical protein